MVYSGYNLNNPGTLNTYTFFVSITQASDTTVCVDVCTTCVTTGPLDRRVHIDLSCSKIVFFLASR